MKEWNREVNTRANLKGIRGPGASQFMKGSSEAWGVPPQGLDMPLPSAVDRSWWRIINEISELRKWKLNPPTHATLSFPWSFGKKVDRMQYWAIKLASWMEKQTDLTVTGKGTKETLAPHQRKQRSGQSCLAKHKKEEKKGPVDYAIILQTNIWKRDRQEKQMKSSIWKKL